MPRVIGLFGGTGAGKSTVAARLAESGCTVIDADDISREVVLPGTTGYSEVVRAFGPEIVDQKGTIDRRKLASIVFSDPHKLERLEGIVHPLMRGEIERRIHDAATSTVVLDCAVLLKPAFRGIADEIWLVTAPERLRRDRIMSRDHLTEEEASLRMGAQQTDCEMQRAAHRVLNNNGSPRELYEQLEDALSSMSGGE